MSTSLEDVGYVPTSWENNVTPLNATNLNHMENGIFSLDNNKMNKAKILWENSYPDSFFAGQTINLDSSFDYDMLQIICYDYITPKRYFSQFLIKNQKNTVFCIFRANETRTYAGYREISFINSTRLEISPGYKLIDAGSEATGTDSNWVVPVYIIGYKTGAFDEEETSI